jgi:ATP-dependent Clp protease ATP-binding subunit ClpC
MRVPPSYRAAENADLTEGPYERFDEESRQVLSFAREEATRLGHHWIGGEHLLLGLARAAENSTSDHAFREAIAKLGITVERLRDEVAKIQPSRQPQAGTRPMKFTGSTKLIIELAIQAAGPTSPLRPRHLLAGLGASEDSIATYVLARFGAKPGDLLRAADRGDSAAD